MNLELILEVLLNLLVAGGAVYLYVAEAGKSLLKLQRWLTASA